MISRSARALIGAVNLYQGLTVHRPSPCRYQPTCSAYAKEAIELHGSGRGAWLALRRVGRCHPLGGHGFDPVPDPPAVGSVVKRRSCTS